MFTESNAWERKWIESPNGEFTDEMGSCVLCDEKKILTKISLSPGGCVVRSATEGEDSVPQIIGAGRRRGRLVASRYKKRHRRGGGGKRKGHGLRRVKSKSFSKRRKLTECSRKERG